ncbi:putative lipoprotein [Rhizobium azibense]|nr:putative lipoprotein [Rhizobium azibense]
MSTPPDYAASKPSSGNFKLIASAALAVIVVGAIALDTTVVKIGSADDVRQRAFSAETFGAEQFPKIKANVEDRAVAVAELAAAIAADKKAAAEKYGTATSTGPVIPVTLTGVFGARKANISEIKVDGLPPQTVVRVQTGPAVNGTDLRDATGTIEFGQFTNQIQYQDAGSAINNEMKKSVFAGLDPDRLDGKTATVVGVFKLINPKNWLVTPVKVEVK